MNKESLELAMKRVIERIATMDAPLLDRIELMENLVHFLQNYEEHLKVLQEYESNKKKTLKYKLDKIEE